MKLSVIKLFITVHIISGFTTQNSKGKELKNINKTSDQNQKLDRRLFSINLSPLFDLFKGGNQQKAEYTGGGFNPFTPQNYYSPSGFWGRPYQPPYWPPNWQRPTYNPPHPIPTNKPTATLAPTKTSVSTSTSTPTPTKTSTPSPTPKPNPKEPINDVNPDIDTSGIPPEFIIPAN